MIHRRFGRRLRATHRLRRERLRVRDREGARRQLQNGKLLAQYLLAMTKLHGEVHSDPVIVYRGIVFSPHIRAPKPGLKALRSVFEQDDRLPELGSRICPPVPYGTLMCSAAVEIEPRDPSNTTFEVTDLT